MERLTVNKLGNLLIKEAEGEYRSPCYGCENIDFCKPEKERVCGLYKALDKLKEYEDLDDQGLIPKCIPGDMVYIPKPGKSLIVVCEVIEIVMGVENTQYYISQFATGLYRTRFFEEDIGKTVFLTKAEAKEALKRMEEQDNVT